tara:strand:- start:399 stop:1031 length:633 start_codon:yes stop_codon:yes gene_type:complete
MEVIRVIKTRDYTTICNRIYKNSNLSLKAKGLLSLILSLSTHWNLSVGGLTKICKEGKSSINNTIKELIDHGYIDRVQLRKDNKFNGYQYIVFESPHLSSSNNTKTGNDQGLNTLRNKVSINKISKERFKKPDIEEIKVYCSERSNNVDPERFFNYYESKGWKVGKSPMKNWKACIRTWESRNSKGMSKIHKHLSSHVKAQELLKQSRNG